MSTLACAPAVGTGDTEGETGSGSVGVSTTQPDPTTTPSTSSTTTSPPSTVTTAPPTTADTSGDSGSSETGSTTGGVPACEEGNCPIDIVVVVDNSARTAGAQEALALGMIELEAELRAIGADFHVMFTTTDFGNPLCTAFQPAGYEPSRGSPITTACTNRLSDFTGLGAAVNAETACTNVCPEGIGPIGDPFVASNGLNQNVPELTKPVDVDGDGMPENEVARAMACLAPMGINGCAYESPLENMLQALNPAAPWNTAARPFLRDGAAVGIVLLTDELDCSVSDYSMMTDTTLMEVRPATGQPGASSALCWNAGADCEGPGPEGTYDCEPVSDDNLHPPARYTNYLQDTLAADLNKPVYMLGLLGVPAVTGRMDRAPFTPTAGGILDLETRDWVEADVLPEDAALGVTVADQQFAFGVGPSCSRPQSTTRQQGIPPVRIAEVCDGLSGPESQRCCIESICDDDYTAGMRCLVGMFQAG
ncbi:MAG: hypothetical protein KUG77_28405 [Nannocystaceae bacterium]|nr:hypothetical protein [Nannocystaceae bacterium]